MANGVACLGDVRGRMWGIKCLTFAWSLFVFVDGHHLKVGTTPGCQALHERPVYGPGRRSMKCDCE